MNSKSFFCKPRIHVLSSMLLGCACCMPATAAATDSILSKMRFDQLVDGDVKLAPVGHRGGLHMTFKSPVENRDAYSAVHADSQGAGTSGIHLSVSMPWK